MSKRTDAVNRQINSRARGSIMGYFNAEFLDDEGIKIYRAKAGENFISIVPPPDEDSYFGLEIFAHFNVGVSNQAFLCPRMMADDPCPLCEESLRLRRSNEDVDERILKTLNPFPHRFLFWIVDASSAETEKLGVQLYDAPMTVNDEILALSKDRKTGQLIDISDAVDGKVLAFDRVGTGIQTKYKGFGLEDREPLLESWLNAAVELEQVIVIATYDEIKKAWDGGEVEEPDDAQDELAKEEHGEDEPPPHSRRRGAVKKELEDIGDELDKQDDEPEDPKERMKRNLRKRKAKEQKEE